MTPKEYLKAGGRLIHEENLYSKISCQTPFKRMRTNKKLSIGFCMVKHGPVLFAAAAVLGGKDRKEVQGTNLAGTGSSGIGTG